VTGVLAYRESCRAGLETQAGLLDRNCQTKTEDFNMMVTRVVGFMRLAAGLIGSLLTACASTRERTCSAGEYPVWSVRYPETGGACVPEGDQPPPRYATYPPGLVPQYEDETITCSPAGKCVDGPLAIQCPDTYPADPCRIAGRSLPSP